MCSFLESGGKVRMLVKKMETRVQETTSEAMPLSLDSSVQFSCSLVSNSLGPHELQHARPPCPSPTPGVYPNSFPLIQ